MIVALVCLLAGILNLIIGYKYNSIGNSVGGIICMFLSGYNTLKEMK